MYERNDRRFAHDLRALQIISGVSPYAEGSAEVRLGRTHILVTASVLREIPRWMKPGSGGWITAEYGMLPRSTHSRNRREAAAGKQSGRTLEIQRLIGRALRQMVDTSRLGEVTIQVDCDVLTADGGTRTAAIMGGCVAVAQAIAWCKQQGLVSDEVPVRPVTALSLGKVAGTLLLDLNYDEDSQADFDLNVVFSADSKIVEVQGTAERSTITDEELLKLLQMGRVAATEVLRVQQGACAPALGLS